MIKKVSEYQIDELNAVTGHYVACERNIINGSFYGFGIINGYVLTARNFSTQSCFQKGGTNEI